MREGRGMRGQQTATKMHCADTLSSSKRLQVQRGRKRILWWATHPRHEPDGVEGVGAVGGLAGQHDGVRAVQHRVCHVRALGARGAGCNGEECVG